MALYAIGDLHLSLNSNKSMEVFGPAWENYTERIRASLSQLTAEDVLEVKRVALNELMKERKTHEKLRDKKFEDFQKEEKDNESKEIDQLVSFTYNS